MTAPNISIYAYVTGSKPVPSAYLLNAKLTFAQGEGKTTVVGPLLSLILADGDSLVVQVSILPSYYIAVSFQFTTLIIIIIIIWILQILLEFCRSCLQHSLSRHAMFFAPDFRSLLLNVSSH